MLCWFDEKSCKMIVSTTLEPCEWAVPTSPESWLEFHSAQPPSFAKVPLVCTWSPKKATVLSKLKSHVP